MGAAVRDALRRPVVVALLVGTFLAAVLQTQMFSTFAIFLSDRVGLSKASIGLLYTVNGVTVLAAPARRAARHPRASAWARRWSARRWSTRSGSS